MLILNQRYIFSY